MEIIINAISVLAIVVACILLESIYGFRVALAIGLISWALIIPTKKV